MHEPTKRLLMMHQLGTVRSNNGWNHGLWSAGTEIPLLNIHEWLTMEFLFQLIISRRGTSAGISWNRNSIVKHPWMVNNGFLFQLIISRTGDSPVVVTQSTYNEEEYVKRRIYAATDCTVPNTWSIFVRDTAYFTVIHRSVTLCFIESQWNIPYANTWHIPTWLRNQLQLLYCHCKCTCSQFNITPL